MKPTAIPHPHTPGPWHYEPADRGDDSVGIGPSPAWIYANPDGEGDYPICTLDEPERRAAREPVDEYDECREAFGTIAGNGPLIAAAPDLLALARAVAEHFADTDAPLGARARAAILNAEGRKPNE